MALFKKKTTNEEQRPASLGIVDPLVNKFYRWVNKTPANTRRAYGYTVIALVMAVTVLSLYVTMPRYVQVAIGLPLSLALFLTGLGFSYLVKQHKEATDDEWVSLKDRYSPKQRIRVGIFVGAITIILSIMVGNYIPYILGGILVPAILLTLANYIRRTPEELVRAELGELDPRDEEEDEEEIIEEPEEEAPSAEETEAYMQLVNSLPEEERKILLNPKLNGALAVVDEDDINKKKKRRLFRK